MQRDVGGDRRAALAAVHEKASTAQPVDGDQPETADPPKSASAAVATALVLPG
jgi:hypothetical protein